MCLIIGVGAGKFLRVGRIFAQISLNLSKRFCATFAYKFSLIVTRVIDFDPSRIIL